MFTSLLPEWLCPFVYWTIITFFYWAPNKLVSNQLKNHEDIIRWYQSIFYIVTVIISITLFTFIVYGMFIKEVQNDDESRTYSEGFDWISLLVISLPPSLIGVFMGIKRHNKNLYELYSKEFFKKEK